MKICCQCKQVKSLSGFYKDSRRLDGHRSECKFCHNAARKRYCERNLGKNKEYLHKLYADPEYYERHKANVRAYYHKNRDECNARHKEWAKRNPHYQRDRYRNDPECRARDLAYSKKRRALRRGASTAELVDRQAIIERDNATCYLCGRGPLTDSEIHLDHVIPLSKGGPHAPDNLKVTCVSCNLSKGDKILG